MKLKSIKIFNYGVFQNETKILLEQKFSVIIGKNGTGKSTILFALKLLFDKRTRSKGIPVEWIPDPNMTPTINYVFSTKEFEKIGVALPIQENSIISIKIELLQDEEQNLFFPSIIIGNMESLRYSHFQNLPFDNFIDIIYIPPSIDSNVEEWIEEYFKEKDVLKQIDLNIDLMNEKISQINGVGEFNKKLDINMKSAMEVDSFPLSLEANIRSTRISKALSIFPKDISGKTIHTHGYGYEKVLSIISHIEEKMDNKKLKIIVIDELENSFFYTYQTKMIEYLRKHLNHLTSQIVITTHSPNIVKTSPNYAITKLIYNEEPKFFSFSEEQHFEYYQKDLSTAIFYEKVLVVEGHSEKIFFEYLFKRNEPLIKMLNLEHTNIYVFNNQGVPYINTIKLLKTMVNKVVILTDNDVWKRGRIEWCQGLQRIKGFLQEFYSIEFMKNHNDLSVHFIESNVEMKKQIIDKGFEHNIYTQEKLKGSFESSLKDDKLIDEEDYKQLKSSKLKNLSPLLDSICKKVTEEAIKESKYLFKWVGKMCD